jgi:hypothetical protein
MLPSTTNREIKPVAALTVVPLTSNSRRSRASANQDRKSIIGGVLS